jgi:hypothetical protein
MCYSAKNLPPCIFSSVDKNATEMVGAEMLLRTSFSFLFYFCIWQQSEWGIKEWKWKASHQKLLPPDKLL